jgi:aminomethyltransferase
VVNAANTDRDLAWVTEHAGADAVVDDRSAATALLALQGPRAARALGTLTGIALASMRPFTVRHGEVAGVSGLVSRTGYTGEDGFEVLVPADSARTVWDALLAAARQCGGMPCGLAARDTLRLEAALPLCGTDMDADTTPLEAGLGWVVKLGKPAFIGREALALQAERGVPRRLVGLELEEPGIPRHGYPVWCVEARVGVVTSGTKSPTLGTFIGMAYVDAASAPAGTALAVEIRGRRLPARVVARPFYRRPASGASHATA